MNGRRLIDISTHSLNNIPKTPLKSKSLFQIVCLFELVL